MFKSATLSQLTAGFVAILVGCTSTVVLIFQAAAITGASTAEVSSWLLSLGIGMGITCIGFSLYYRIPILTAWSTPGAALLITSLSGATLPETIGIFIFSASLSLLAGITGFFEKIMSHIPRSFAAAMLAGILLHFGTNIFVAMQNQFLLVCAMFFAYLMGKRFFPRFVILVVLLLGIIIVNVKGLCHISNFHLAMSKPIFTAPVFTVAKLIGVGIPLFIVTMVSQNIPGFAVIRTAGYKAPVSSIITVNGLVNLILAPFGAFAINLAAITAAICLSKEADADPTTRYKATMYGGIFYLLFGLFSATVVMVFSALPQELILAIAGLALLSTIGNSLQAAVEDESQREPALITFLVSASGISLFGIGAAFWGLVAGFIALVFLKAFKTKVFATS
jgi:benzoate membrane transport protein